MEKPTKVFISSPSGDLERHRQVLIETIMKMGSALNVIAMEHFGSNPLNSVQLSIAKVNESDIYVGILGWCYGTIDKQSRMSIAEIEYRTALAKRIPILLYLASPEQEGKPNVINAGKNASRMRKLKKEISESHTVQYFSTPEDLSRRVAADLHAFLSNNSFITKAEFINPDTPVGPEINPTDPFVLCHFAQLSKLLGDYGYYDIQLYIDLYYDEDTPEYTETMSSVDRVVYQLHKTFPMPVIPMQNWRENWLLNLHVWGEFWVRGVIYFKDSKCLPLSLLRYINISLPKTCMKEQYLKLESLENV